MIYGKRLVSEIGRMIPGASAQFGYHGCNRASVQVFHDSARNKKGSNEYGLIADFNCRCDNWGKGMLDITPTEIAAEAKARLAEFAEKVGA